jgi:hypothetical protein
MSDRDAFPMDIYDRAHPTHQAWNFKPEGFLVVMLVSSDEAERAMDALQQNGFAPQDMKHYPSEEIVANFEAYLGRLGAKDKVLGAFLDDTEGRDRYVADARDGYSALWIRIPDADRVPRAIRVLADRRYRHARYYGTDGETDLDVTP